MKKNECPLCYNHIDEKYIVDKVNRIWKNSKDIYQCRDCDLYFIEEPSNEEIEALYKSDFYNKNSSFIYSYIEKKIKYARALNRYNYIKKFIEENKKINILEIGASDGTLLNFFKRDNHNILGYELNNDAREKAKKNFNITMKEDFLKADENEKYDIIIMSHILEHFVDPRSIIKHIHSMLNDNGLLYIEIPSTPNHNNFNEMGILFETEHTLHFNINSISKLLKDENFNIVEILYNEYNSKENVKRNICLGVLSINAICGFLDFFIKIIFNPKKAFIDYNINKKEYFSIGQNIRLIAKKK